MISERIIQNSKNKSIVFWGGWNETDLIKKIEKVKKIKYVCVNPKTIECDKKLEPIATLSGKADQYYVVVFPKETKEIREMFEKFGYLSDDIFYINHCPIRVEKDGTDKYGNTLKGFNNLKNKSILVFFEGYEANVCLGENIECEKMKIIAGGNTNIMIDDNCKFNGECFFSLRNLDSIMKSEIKIGNECSFISGTFSSFGGKINIGNHSTYGKEFRATASYGMAINIGVECMFSHEIALYSGDGHTIYDVQKDKVLNSVNSMPEQRKKLDIGNHVWVGYRSVILNNSRIGDGSIIGADSLVKNQFPNNCMIAGKPARVLKKNIAWSRNPIPIDSSKMMLSEEMYYNFTEEEMHEYL